MRNYYLSHCNTVQMCSWCTEYSLSEVNRYPAIYVISCVGEKNGKIKIVSSFSAVKLCFVINVLNNKLIILLNLAECDAYGYLGSHLSFCLLPKCERGFISSTQRHF